MQSPRFVVLMVALGASVACGQREPAEGPTAHPPAEPLTVVRPSEEPPPPPPEPAASAEPEPEPEPPPSLPSLRELCGKVCAKVATKCPASVAEACELNCDRYDKVDPRCDHVARDALACSLSASDLPCANVAPESCGKEFKRLARCQRSPETFTEHTEQAHGAPTGWQRYEPSAGGFSVLMPQGVEASSVGQEDVHSVRVGNVRYVVRKLPPPTEMFTSKSQVRLAMAWLAPCNYKLKLHGHVDKDDRLSVHYDSACKDGTELHGVLHITKNALYIVGTEAPPGERGELDAFLYSFMLR